MSTQSSPSLSQPQPRASTEHLHIPVTDDVSLEAVLKIPVINDDPGSPVRSSKVAIISHPWSWLGGSMHDQVLHNLSAVFLKLGYHVILFNTRGVGESSGRASFTGISESQDLRAVLAWAVEEIVHLDTAVLVGYSYGSLITSMVPSPKRLHPERIKRAAHILISHPLGPMASFITFFNTAKYTSAFDQVLADPGLDVLLIYGNNDQFFSLKRYESWVARCREIRGQASENPGAPLGHGAEDETIPPTIPIANAIGVCSTTSPPTRGVDSVNPRASVSTGPRGPRKLEEKMIEHGDHFWRGSSGTYLRNAVSDWVEKL